jgi:hypothetical protein
LALWIGGATIGSLNDQEIDRLRLAVVRGQDQRRESAGKCCPRRFTPDLASVLGFAPLG